jgi:hypothetical protein
MIMNIFELEILSDIAIIFIFAVLMGTAAWSKFSSLSTPEWFVKQFENTRIAKLPFGADLAYWKIAIFEAVLTIVFIASLFMPILLPYALTGSLFLFGVLCFGLRITGDFQGSANMFIYFAATLVSLQMVR